MSVDKIQRQRFEKKYIIGEQTALSIRDFISCYLEPDEYGVTQDDYSYPVHSLYFDSPSLKTYKDTVNGDRNRFKLRVRFYENAPEKPVFFEIKRRYNRVITKQRAAVTREFAAEMAAGYLPSFDNFYYNDPMQYNAAERFCELQNLLQATPRVHVAYRREAWKAHGVNSVRVTMDRQVLSEPRQDFDLSPDMTDPVNVFGDDIVLELKFTDRFPDWFQELVQVYGLREESAAKYVDGILIHGEQKIASPIYHHI